MTPHSHHKLNTYYCQWPGCGAIFESAGSHAKWGPCHKDVAEAARRKISKMSRDKRPKARPVQPAPRIYTALTGRQLDKIQQIFSDRANGGYAVTAPGRL